jgi:TolA-binding protein
MERFREIIERFPQTEYSVRAQFQIGLLQYERFHDLDGSLASFAAVERELPEANTVSYAVSLMIGEVLTARGDTTDAARRFSVVMNAPGALPDQQDEATFRLAELAYFRGEFKVATDLLGSLTLDLQVDYANDALRLLTFLQENTRTSAEALRSFAQADYFGRQRQYGEAVRILHRVVEQNSKALLVDDALMLAGRFQTESGEYNDAIDTYQQLIKVYPEASISLDKAWFAIAEIHQFRLNDATAATAAYQSLLADFPSSILAEQARKRIRELRGL